ncbi:MAG TPA: hypothetical protein VJ878_00325 [Candidatus Izemoplasmatales bacterium]|nr:hypothetical protein [Candidatus Izemoplasmatales bacterium]
MKKLILFLVWLMLFPCLACQLVFRDFQDENLERMSLEDFNFSTYATFKIIDHDTALSLTGNAYQNSGIILGMKENVYQMVFVPRRVREDPFIITDAPYYNLEEIYDVLANYVENPIFLQDYGGLSLSVRPYENYDDDAKARFNHPLFFIVTTDNNRFYCQYEGEKLLVYDDQQKEIYSSKPS